MTTFLRTRNHHRFVTILLIVAMMLSFFSGMRFNSYTTTSVVTTCPQAKAAQSHAERHCQFTASLTGILDHIASFILSITGKLSFLFVVALTVSGFRDRLYKPPKLLLSI